MTGAPVDPVDEAVETPGIPAAPAPAIKPPRIESIALCDFRAFAGPETVTIELGGKNLLIYGENGAGKSSIFHALDGFFSVPSPAENAETRRAKLAKMANRFTEKAKIRVTAAAWTYKDRVHVAGDNVDVLNIDVETSKAKGDVEPISTELNASVTVKFSGTPGEIRWDKTRHPVDTELGAESLVVNAAYKKAILDYRSLLDTNYKNGDGDINLFDICVRVLLRDFQLTYDGANQRLFDLWGKLLQLLDLEGRNRSRLSKSEKAEVLRILPVLNDGLRSALERVLPKIGPLLDQLGWKDIKVIGFNVPGLTYQDQVNIPATERIENKIVGLDLQFLGHTVDKPQNFLNEARLSALALAIYLAGRQVCADTTVADTPLIMVLDDVLIGLDQSNRMPVIDLIADTFSNWQIVLLTHDKTWFEIARSYQRRHKADRFWNYARIHSDGDPIKAPVVVSITSSAATDAITSALRFLTEGHINAAANYARIAAEFALREFCEEKKLTTSYRQQPDKTPFSELLSAAKSNGGGKYSDVLNAIEEFTSILLNPLSHGGTSSLTSHEVNRAIIEVEKLLFALKVTPTGYKAPN